MNYNQPWLQRLKSKECPDATYESKAFPLVLKRAEGSSVWDVNDSQYTDLCCGFGSLALGHRHSSLQKVLQESQLIQGMGDVFANQYKVNLLEELIAKMPDYLTKAALAISGGQAVELAMKTAMLSSGSHGFIVLNGGYHGLDLGLLPLASRPDFRAPFEKWYPVNAVQHVAFDCDQHELNAAYAKLQDAGIGLAGVIVEPVMGRHGVRPLTTSQLRMFSSFAHRHGGLVIFDEVMTGMGRTGTYCHGDQVDVDLVCFGKILGGGLPISACVGKEEVMGAWPESRGEAIHTGTYFGHALSCHAALATIRQIADEGLVERSSQLGDEIKQFLADSLTRHSIVREIRGKGMLIGIEFNEPQVGLKLMEALLRRGVITLPAGEEARCLSMTPALNIPKDQLLAALEHLVQEIADF